MSNPTVRELILRHVYTLLSSVVTVYRSREAPVIRQEGVVAIMAPEEDESEYKALAMIKKTMILKITVIARGDVADSVADPVIGQIHLALMADSTLGGLAALIVDESTKWDFELADQNAVAVEMRYKIQYLTSAKDITVAS